MEVSTECARLGARLKDARLHAGMSLSDVVEAMGHLGPWFKMSQKTLRNWEAGRNMPCLLQFRELCALYGVMGYRILFGNAPIDFGRAEAQELRALTREASPVVQQKIALMLALVRVPDEETA